MKRAARTLSGQVRADMQATIDREKGSKAMSRGIMPRLVKHPLCTGIPERVPPYPPTPVPRKGDLNGTADRASARCVPAQFDI